MKNSGINNNMTIWPLHTPKSMFYSYWPEEYVNMQDKHLLKLENHD